MSTGALIIGGGPAGYATAIALAQQNVKNITVLERTPSAEHFDSSKSFVYALTRHGKAALAAMGVNNIDDVGLSTAAVSLKILAADGSVKERAPQAGQADVHAASTWIPRHTLNKVLYDHIADCYADSIRVSFSSKVDSIQLPVDKQEALVVTTISSAPDSETQKSQADPSRQERYNCQLLIGADGASSCVRRALSDTQNGGDFSMHVAPSLSGGLAYKVLTLPPCPRLSTAAGKAESGQTIFVPGVPVRGHDVVRMVLLPVKDTAPPRPAIFVLPHDHPLWQISSADSLYEYFDAAFPQVENWTEVLPREYAQQFVDADVGVFRQPQCSQKLVHLMPDARAPNASDQAFSTLKGCAAMLIGDAAHVFPPDLGQGVNSALLDVSSLMTALEKRSNDANAALLEYEQMRLPENRALLRLHQIGWPFQYGQSGHAIKQKLMMVNMIGRTLISKLLPWMVSPQVGFAVAAITPCEPTDSPLTLYQDELAKGERTTRNLVLVLAAGLMAVLLLVAKLAGWC